LLRSKLLDLRKWLWAYCSFFVPCFLYLGLNASPFSILRSGLIGLCLAFLIYFLWKLSLRLHGIILPERNNALFIMVSAILLWITWFTVAQVILIAYDELTIR